MVFERLSASVQTLYAELLELEQIASATASAGPVVSGTFVSKSIKGRTYWYLQRSEGSTTRQYYLGPDSSALRKWMEQGDAARAARRPDDEVRRSLAAMLRSGGATAEPAAVIKVLAVLAQAGIFRLGGVLVGTQAFRVLGNLLGVRFGGAAMRTQDVDVAADPTIGIALAGEPVRENVTRRLGELEPPYLPVPGLDPREPSTTFMVRGRQFRVDFLTPARPRGREGPVLLAHLGCAAQPVRFLEYLLEDAVQAVVIGSESVLVSVPDPARFALHKLFTASSRGAAHRTKAGKDLIQAVAVIEVLLADRPADLAKAWRAVASRTARTAITAAARSLEPGLREQLVSVIERGAGT